MPSSPLLVAASLVGVSFPSHKDGLLARGSGVSVARELLPRLLPVPGPVGPRRAVGGAGAGAGPPSWPA